MLHFNHHGRTREKQEGELKVFRREKNREKSVLDRKKEARLTPQQRKQMSRSYNVTIFTIIKASAAERWFSTWLHCEP